MHGINAAVVGILGTALYNPVWRSAVLNTEDFAIAVTGFVLLVVWRTPPLVVVGQLLDWLSTSLLATVITTWWRTR